MGSIEEKHQSWSKRETQIKKHWEIRKTRTVVRSHPNIKSSEHNGQFCVEALCVVVHEVAASCKGDSVIGYWAPTCTCAAYGGVAWAEPPCKILALEVWQFSNWSTIVCNFGRRMRVFGCAFKFIQVWILFLFQFKDRNIPGYELYYTSLGIRIVYVWLWC